MDLINHLYATSIKFTPIFNNRDLKKIYGGEDGMTLKIQDGLIRELEAVLFPDSMMKVIAKFDDHIIQIETEEYPSIVPLYTDARLVQFHENCPPSRYISLPTQTAIIHKMLQMIQRPYVWGGNCYGIDEFFDLYPSKNKWEDLPDTYQNLWKMRGVDCSGLLYYATNGYTPRNTSDLITFGRSLSISTPLLPLDLITWKGHVVIILDGQNTIESLGGKGVIVTPIKERITQIEENLSRQRVNSWDEQIDIPENHRYVIQRWYPG